MHESRTQLGEIYCKMCLHVCSKCAKLDRNSWNWQHSFHFVSTDIRSSRIRRPVPGSLWAAICHQLGPAEKCHVSHDPFIGPSDLMKRLKRNSSQQDEIRCWPRDFFKVCSGENTMQRESLTLNRLSKWERQIRKDWVSNCCNQNLHACCSADTTCPCRAACRSLKVSPFQSHAADLPLYCPTVLRWRQIKACCPFPRMNLCAQSIFALFQTWHQVLSTWIKFRVYLQGFSNSCSFFLRNMDPTFLLEILGIFAWIWSLKGSLDKTSTPAIAMLEVVLKNFQVAGLVLP